MPIAGHATDPQGADQSSNGTGTGIELIRRDHTMASNAVEHYW